MHPEQSAEAIAQSRDEALLQQLDAHAAAREAAWKESLGAAMGELGFSEAEHAVLLDVLAALLHLGNCAFVPDGSVAHGDNAAKLQELAPVEHAAALLGRDDRSALIVTQCAIGLRIRAHCPCQVIHASLLAY